RGLIFHTEPVPDRRAGNDRAPAKAAVPVAPILAEAVGTDGAAAREGLAARDDLAAGSGGHAGEGPSSVSGEGSGGAEPQQRAGRRRRRAASGTNGSEVVEAVVEVEVAPELAVQGSADASLAGSGSAEGELGEARLGSAGEGFEEVFEDELPPGGRRRTRRGTSRRRTRP
ncbi:MAG: hypothetical protein JXA67_13310, partial [Micromonosporaceae bacterium]|nr:hypothetical protein [Micromonosporaceae bacterium]